MKKNAKWCGDKEINVASEENTVNLKINNNKVIGGETHEKKISYTDSILLKQINSFPK